MRCRPTEILDLFEIGGNESDRAGLTIDDFANQFTDENEGHDYGTMEFKINEIAGVMTENLTISIIIAGDSSQWFLSYQAVYTDPTMQLQNDSKIETVHVGVIPHADNYTVTVKADADNADEVSREETFIVSSESSILLDEDFNDEFPGDWEIIAGGSTNHTWTRVETRWPDNSLDGTHFMIADSDAAGMGQLMNEQLITPKINIPDPQGKLMLSFEHFYRHFGSSSGKVQVYDGAEWLVVNTFNESTGSWDSPAVEEIDITEHANEELQVSFHYEAGWDWFWAIDNVKIEVVEYKIL